MTQTSNIIIRVTKELHREFKKLCIDEDTTMQNYITSLLKRELKDKKGIDIE